MFQRGSRILWLGCGLALGCWLVQCGDGAGPGDTTPPEVISTTPVSGAGDVPIGSIVRAVFSEDIDQATLSEESFYLSQGNVRVAGTLFYSNQTATFTPGSPLAYDTPYQATVTQEVTDKAGNTLEAPHTWTFTTEAQAGTPPDAPQTLDVTVGDGQLVLDWSLSEGATTYNLYWSNTTGVTRQNGTRLPAVTGPYTHSGLTNDTEYFYVVTAENEFGESTESPEASGTPRSGATLPLPPANLTATGADQQVTLDWDPRTEATSYNIYWSTEAGVDRYTGTQINTATPPYIHTGLTNGTTYYYVVTTVNDQGESVESVQVSATPAQTGTPPVAPTEVAAMAGNGEISISWAPVADATSYNIYWGSSPGVTVAGGTQIVSVTSPHTHSGLTNGTAYYYIVTAINQYGESPPSTEVSETPIAGLPAAPTGVTAEGADGQVTISWSPVPGATSYNIYWDMVSGVSPQSGAQMPDQTSPATQTGLTNGYAYYYVVTAVNTVGEGPASSEVSATPLPPLPGAPTGVVAVAGNQEVSVSWNAVAGAESYTLYWANGPGVTPTNGSPIADATSPYLHSGLSNQLPYYYVVTASNLAGEGPSSAEVDATPFNPGPDAPTNLVAVPGNGSVTLSWDPAAGATAYNLYWSLNPAVTPINGSRIAAVSSPFAHSGPTNGFTYHYVVTAENAQGESPPSNIAFATPEEPDSQAPQVVSTGPKAGEIGAGAGEVLWVVFSEPMNPSSLNATSFILLGNGGPINGTVAYDGLTATFTPSSPLTFRALYTATVTTAANDLAGNGLAVDHTWSFTVQPPAPQGLTGVAGNTEATILWDAVSGTSVYYVYRATTTGGPYAILGRSPGTTFTQRGLDNDSTTYYYVVTAVTAEGESPYSNEVGVRPMGSLLRAPANLRATGRNGQVDLTWDQVAADLNYRVLRSATERGPYVEVATVVLNEAYTDRGLANDTTYYYVVQTVLGALLSGAYSDEARATTSAALPVAPSNLTATSGSTWARLTWSAVTGATHYVVYRSTTSDGPYSIVSQPPATSTTETGLVDGTTYYYVVAAMNATGVGALSSEVTVAPLASLSPLPPVLQAKRGNAQVVLSWNAVAGASQYRILRGTSQGGPYADLGPFTSPHTDSTVVNNTTYFYVVQARSAGLTNADSNEVQVTPSTVPPPAPTGLTAHAGNGRVTLTWNPVADAESYGWCESATSGGPYSCWCCGSNELIAEDVSMINGQPRYYVVFSRAPGGLNSAYSAQVSETPMSTLPEVTTGAWVRGGNGQLSYTWYPVSGATGYQVFRRTADSGWSQVGTLANGPFLDASLANGTQYYYRVAAVNASGSGGLAGGASGTPRDTAPLAPTGVVALAGNGRNSIVWDPVVGADSYGWCESASPGGPYSCWCCGSGGLFAEDTSLTNGQPRYYVAFARTPGAQESVYSTEVSATPMSTLPEVTTGSWIRGGNGQLSYTWYPVSGATGYQVFRRTAESAWSHVGTVATGPFLDDNLANGTRYYYKVAVVNAAGSGGLAGDANGIPNAFAPPAPTGVAALAGNGWSSLVWDPVVEAESYGWCESASPGGPYSCWCCGSTDLFADDGQTNGLPRYYVVFARTRLSLESVYSSEVSATPMSTLPEVAGSSSVQGGNAQLSCTWSPVSGANGYQVYRRAAGTGWMRVGDVTAGPFLDRGLDNGTQYFYRVAAVNASGSGRLSGSANGTTSPDRPLAPTGVVAHAGNSDATITWNPVEGATYYAWCEAASPGGPHSCWCCGSTDLIVNDGLTSGQTRYYLVYAGKDPGSLNSVFSYEVSATASATLPARPGSLNSSAGAGQISLTWGSVSGSFGYRVYRRLAGSSWHLAGEVAGTDFVDTGLVSGTTCRYTVSAVNAAGEGAWSDVRSATPN